MPPARTPAATETVYGFLTWRFLIERAEEPLAASHRDIFLRKDNTPPGFCNNANSWFLPVAAIAPLPAVVAAEYTPVALAARLQPEDTRNKGDNKASQNHSRHTPNRHNSPARIHTHRNQNQDKNLLYL